MADISAEIEALELRLMRAWVAGDRTEMKKLIARDGMCMTATLPPQLLDRPSVLAAIDEGFACTAFRMREVFVSQHGRMAWFVAGMELELRLGVKPWQGAFLVTDLWHRQRIGGWKLAQRSLARIDASEGLADRLRPLQLWNR